LLDPVVVHRPNHQSPLRQRHVPFVTSRGGSVQARRTSPRRIDVALEGSASIVDRQLIRDEPDRDGIGQR
jgi:hypothetical protein